MHQPVPVAEMLWDEPSAEPDKFAQLGGVECPTGAMNQASLMTMFPSKK